MDRSGAIVSLPYDHRVRTHPLNVVMLQLLYSGKLSREKTFANFVVLWLYTKITKFGAWHPLAWEKQAIRESLKIEFSPICESFLSRKFPAIR